MPPRIVKVSPLPQYRLQVEFDDGVAGTIDLSGELDCKVFRPLRDEAVFRQVTVDEFGAVCWPNGPDLAPDAMHSELAGEPPTRPERSSGRAGRRLKTASGAVRRLAASPIIAHYLEINEANPGYLLGNANTAILRSRCRAAVPADRQRFSDIRSVFNRVATPPPILFDGLALITPTPTRPHRGGGSALSGPPP